MTAGMEIYDGTAAGPLLPTVRSLYAAVYAEPPYFEGDEDVASFASMWANRVAQPQARLVIAREGDRPVGFAFGYRRNTPLLPDSGPVSFFVMELAVLAATRRRGFAGDMMTALLDGNRLPVSLTVRPEAAAAQAVYERWGFERVGQKRQPADDGPLYDVMIRGAAEEARAVNAHRDPP